MDNDNNRSITQTWFYEDNKKAENGNQKYWIYYKNGIATVKSGIKKWNSALKRTKIKSDNTIWLQIFAVQWNQFKRNPE